MCGSESGKDKPACGVCGYNFGASSPSNAGGLKCARCGSAVERGFDFCPICGQNQRRRLARPDTRIIHPESEGPPDQARIPDLTSLSPPRDPTDQGAALPRPPPAQGEPWPPLPPLDQPMHPPAMQQAAALALAPQPEPPVSQPGPATPRLVLVGRDGSEGETVPLPPGPFTLGRVQAHLRFPQDDFVSPLHAQLEPQGDSFVLTDLGSQNGVYLRIGQAYPVYPGDVFMVGHQVLRLEPLEDAAREQPPDAQGTRLFGTPLPPSWAALVLVGRGGLRGDLFGLRGTRVVLGREAGDLVFPNDPFISRAHASLRLEVLGATMSVFLEDLGSANGTYLRIRGQTPLQHGDTFRVGDHILRLRLD